MQKFFEKLKSVNRKRRQKDLLLLRFHWPKNPKGEKTFPMNEKREKFKEMFHHLFQFYCY